MGRNRKASASNFVDYVKINCRSGNGGNGSAHLRREKFVPKGGPDGGDGGRGGHVILRANPQLWTLLHMRYNKHFKAGHGGDGGRQRSTGANGKDVIIEVPRGTVARMGESGELIGEITAENESFILIRGGRGGKGNSHFKSATNQTPRYAQQGKKGEERWITLELKLMADVGLVGYPNAGKSTLLSSISAAKPEIADYPFTTLKPNLGMVPYREHRSFCMADIPGIIEGAHRGKGLGLRFLRHIERNSILLFMIPADSADIKKEYDVLVNELVQHNTELGHKDRVLAVSKCDLADEARLAEIRKALPDVPAVLISSVTGMGLDALKDLLWQQLNR